VKKGFTLIEMLVVIGIIAVLMGAGVGVYSGAVKSAEKKRCQELVADTATALTALYQKNGAWPKALRKGNAVDVELDADAALPLAKAGYMSLSMNNGKLSGYDRFGVVSPWGAAHIKKRGVEASLSDKVGIGSLQDHILHCALDLDGDGIIEGALVGGESVDIRATAAVWCCGKDGVIERYTAGLKKDDAYSWSVGQTQGVK
jgi:prepilin-type N-terminal cleavage/methylation domain-containing protein